LVEKAIAKYKIDVKKSYMIGDNPRDAEAGKRAGLNTILIHSQPDPHADLHYKSLNFLEKDMKNCII
jgi:D-glycero-D-manno-heptose 1,7-bisphosphate phosphatase